MSSRNPPLSIEEVLEIVPSAESWINDGLRGRVLFIEPSPPTARKRYWKTTLGSDTSGARITMTLFSAPKFPIGCLLEITGAGIKRKEFNGADEIGTSTKTEFHVLADAPPQNQPPPRSAPPDDARGGHVAPPASPAGQDPHQPPAPQASPEKPSPIQGSTVGMALKEARELLVVGYEASRGKFTLEDLDSAEFAKRLWQTTSMVIRVSAMLQRGNLAPNPYAKPAPPPAPPPPPPPPPKVETPPPPPPPANQAGTGKIWTPGVDPEDDIPF